jgi:hypothetical protein
MVTRAAGSRYAHLTFDGLRESRTIADKQTRIRVSLPVSELARLFDLLGEHLDAEQ